MNYEKLQILCFAKKEIISSWIREEMKLSKLPIKIYYILQKIIIEEMDNSCCILFL